MSLPSHTCGVHIYVSDMFVLISGIIHLMIGEGLLSDVTNHTIFSFLDKKGCRECLAQRLVVMM